MRQFQWLGLEAIRTAIARSEPILPSSHAIVEYLNVGFCCSQSIIHLHVAPVVILRGCRPCSLVDLVFFMLTGISSKQEMALSDVFTVGSGVFLALSCLAEIVLRELVFVTGLVVDLGSTKVVVRLPIADHSVLLGHHLILVHLGKAGLRLSVQEKLVILICGRSIVRLSFKTHLEIGDSHHLCVPYLSHVLQSEFLRRVRLSSGRDIRHLSCSILGHIQREVGITRLFHKFCVFQLCVCNFVRVELILLTRVVQVLRRRHWLVGYSRKSTDQYT